jgi:hypothetical protein
MTKDDLVSKDTALKMAIKALLTGHHHIDLCNEAINACKEALEQPNRFEGYTTIEIGHKKIAQEPVAWIKQWENMFGKHKDIVFIKTDEYSPLYTHPHQWQGLTDDEINEIVRNVSDDMYPWKGNMLIGKIIRAIEQELKTKNGFSGLKDKNS